MSRATRPSGRQKGALRMTSTPEQPSGTRTGGYGFTPVQGARLPIPGNAEFAVFFLV
jgi:hypothetical protein